MKCSLLIGILVGAFAPTVTEACRVNQPAEMRIARAYDGVVIGVVEEPRSEGLGWNATLRVTEIVEGRSPANRYWIGRSGDSEPVMMDKGSRRPVNAGSPIFASWSLPAGRIVLYRTRSRSLARQMLGLGPAERTANQPSTENQTFRF